MKTKNILLGILLLLAFASHGQTENKNTLTKSEGFAQEDQSTQNKKFSISIGLGYYSPRLSDENVSYPDAQYSPEIGLGFSYFFSFDHALTRDLYVGVGLNGSYAKAKFIKNPTVNGEQINGYLDAGALENLNVLLNITYSPAKGGIQPYAKFGLGYFIQEVELGDIPMRLAINGEEELFPDYKSSGLGVLPELGIKYKLFTLSVAYGLPFNKLTGEEGSEPEAYVSTGSIKAHSLQVNVSYRIFLF